jgi:5-methylcytosine-specific restriction endonuclease McrA
VSAETYGKGTVYQRRSDGLWMAVVEIPRTQYSPRRRKTRSAHTRERAEELLRELHAEIPPRERQGRKANMETAKSLGTHTDAEWFALLGAVDGRCHYCGERPRTFEVEQDHKTPVSRGGSDAIDNIAVSCRGCNEEKGRMTAEEYLAWKVDNPGRPESRRKSRFAAPLRRRLPG